MKVEERSVSGFDQVALSGIGKLLIDRTGTESLTVEAEENLLPLLVTTVDAGRLRIGLKEHSTITSHQPIVYRLQVKSLNALEVSGAGTAEATTIESERLTVDISGAGEVTLAGRAPEQLVELTGSGRFDGRNLLGTATTVRVSGSGQATVNVSERLSADVSGAGLIRYMGSPTVEQETRGVGRVERTK